MSNYGYNNYNSPGPGPHTPGPGPRPPRRSDPVETISWIIDIAMIPIAWPVGLGLTVANALGLNIVGMIIRSVRGDKKASAAKRGPVLTPEQRVSTGGMAAKTTTTRPQAEELVRRPDTGAQMKEVFGWILGAFGIVMTISALFNSAALWTILMCLAMIISGGALVLSGRQGKKKEAAFRRCLTVTGTKGIVRLKPLAKTLGMTETEVEKQLSDMLDRGYYGRRAYIDHARGLLVIEPEQMRDVYRAEDEAKAAKAAQAEREAQAAARGPRSEYDQYIERIRQADIDIEDEAMSEKIRQMQSITESIFKEVEAHPEKRPQIDRFMSYYLPTTLKLLDSYARIESQGVSGENTAKAKADIERIADTLVEGYRKQLDTLYRAEAVDIAGDVGVIESMMKRDGLTGQNDFRPFASHAGGSAAAAAPAEEQRGQTMGGT